MPTGTVMMPLTLGRGISGINACNDASTSMLNISPQFCCLVQSLQTLLCSHSHFEIGRSHHVRRSTSINRLQAQCREDAPGATLTNSELSRMERDGVWRLLCNQRGGGWRLGFGYLRGDEDALDSGYPPSQFQLPSTIQTYHCKVSISPPCLSPSTRPPV